MDSITRRAFLKSAALVGGFAAVAGTRAHAQTTGTATESTGTVNANVSGSDILRVGLIGAGGRGTNAALDAIRSSKGIEIVAIGDAFMDRAEESWENIKKEFPEQCKVTRETLFDGIDNYEKVLKTDCDMVILAAPPGFRPPHLRAAVEAGKHVFAEKPVCIDPAGYRSVVETAEMAKAKGLAIVAGTQRRHSTAYNETMQRIRDGAIGDIVGGQCYWMQQGLWVKEKQPDWSDTEWMMRNWLYFDWTSGDHIVEQHVHNIDVINWAMGGPPVKCIASGGRFVRTDPKYGNIYDHFDVEYEYENGVRTTSMSRQWENTTTRIGERLVGTKGTCDPSGKIEGPNAWSFESDEDKRQPYVDEHKHLIASIRSGEPLNELQRVADSCLTAIMGRMAAYTGQAVSFRWAARASQLDLMPENLELGPREVGPVPMPGVTKLV
jgi:predicted dehydrogenase